MFTKEELLRSIWGYRATGSTRTLDSHACRLRQKLGVHGERFVVNVWGWATGLSTPRRTATAGCVRAVGVASVLAWALAVAGARARAHVPRASCAGGASSWRARATSCAGR